jgi:hypothetical protein
MKEEFRFIVSLGLLGFQLFFLCQSGFAIRRNEYVLACYCILAAIYFNLARGRDKR